MGNLHNLLACTGEEGRIGWEGVWKRGRIVGRGDLGGGDEKEGGGRGFGIGGVGGLGMGC